MSSNVESVEYVILLQEPHAMLIDKSMSGDVSAGDFYHLPRNSLYSARKASYDVRSIGSDGKRLKENKRKKGPYVNKALSCFIFRCDTKAESGPIALNGHRGAHNESHQHSNSGSRVDAHVHITGSR